MSRYLQALQAGLTLLAVTSSPTTSNHLRGNRRLAPPHREAAIPKAAAPAVAADSPCFEGPLTWTSKNGQLLVNNEVFHLKGT